METKVNVSEAKTNLSRLLAQVERGERAIITRAGKPIATLRPIATTERMEQLGPRIPGRDRGKIVIHSDVDDVDDRS